MSDKTNEPCLIQRVDGSLVIGIVGDGAHISADKPCLVEIDFKDGIFRGEDKTSKRVLFSFDMKDTNVNKAALTATETTRPKINIWEATPEGLHFFTDIEFVLGKKEALTA